MLDLIACPKCGGCGYVVELDAASAAFLELPETRQCEGCCAQGYVPVDTDEEGLPPRCPCCKGAAGENYMSLCDKCYVEAVYNCTGG